MNAENLTPIGKVVRDAIAKEIALGGLRQLDLRMAIPAWEDLDPAIKDSLEIVGKTVADRVIEIAYEAKPTTVKEIMENASSRIVQPPQ